MLVSNKIKKVISSEIKSQQTLVKLLENQEENYDVDYSKQKEEINKSIDYYNNILEEAA